MRLGVGDLGLKTWFVTGAVNNGFASVSCIAREAFANAFSS